MRIIFLTLLLLCAPYSFANGIGSRGGADAVVCILINNTFYVLPSDEVLLVIDTGFSSQTLVWDLLNGNIESGNGIDDTSIMTPDECDQFRRMEGSLN